jgi:hypothetical protein
MAAHKWTEFKVTADINTEDIRSLYVAWTTPQGLESWFLRQANFYTVGKRLREADESIAKEDTYEWFWHGYDDSQKGQVLEANGTDMLKFSFSGDSIVTVTIQAIKGISIIELTQENIPEESDPSKNLFVQCQIGWTFYLANLKSIIEGGLDLRNKRMDVSSNFK